MPLSLSKQPLLGIVATIVVSIVSLVFISLFDFHTFAGWVSLILVCSVPVQLIIGPFWHGTQPQFIADRAQPVRGIGYMVFTLLIAVLMAQTMFHVIGGAFGPPRPPVIMFSIFCVVVSFWVIIIWGAWPISYIKQPMVAGILLYLFIHLLAWLLFNFLFNFSFMSGAPIYIESIDPKGLFNAWQVLVFGVTSVSALFIVLSFELWPLTLSPAVMQQPVQRIVWSLYVLVLAAAMFFVGTRVLNMDVVVYLTVVPVSIIFGGIIVLNMLQKSLFSQLRQPVKGVANVIVVLLVGHLLYRIYLFALPLVSGKLSSGPPAYDVEIWLASAMLAVTFPFLIVVADFFQFKLVGKADS
ncbi:MAG: hypothetical protein KTR35_15435 [Gammaproteobacteria bacterium]|nr:hypothetical protein [Gammaproteobacteria bacterium]